jgi:hypothetical protein
VSADYGLSAIGSACPAGSRSNASRLNLQPCGGLDGQQRTSPLVPRQPVRNPAAFHRRSSETPQNGGAAPASPRQRESGTRLCRAPLIVCFASRGNLRNVQSVPSRIIATVPPAEPLYMGWGYIGIGPSRTRSLSWHRSRRACPVSSRVGPAVRRRSRFQFPSQWGQTGRVGGGRSGRGLRLSTER